MEAERLWKETDVNQFELTDLSTQETETVLWVDYPGVEGVGLTPAEAAWLWPQLKAFAEKHAPRPEGATDEQLQMLAWIPGGECTITEVFPQLDLSPENVRKQHKDSFKRPLNPEEQFLREYAQDVANDDPHA